MPYRNIALMGRAGAGKDTVGSRLVHSWGFTRVAFADPLKEMALRIDPVVKYEPAGYGPVPVRLADIVNRWGWEEAKVRSPEIRRTLQRMGQAVRNQDPDYWLTLAMDKVAAADVLTMPVVVTDVRHANEYEALKNRGFTLVRVNRASVRNLGTNGDHVSETDLDGYPADLTITNNGTFSELREATDRLLRRE
ncbi:hypothetical protein OG875_13905 [Streptomyces sp. NBC_01498]|uniref:deoxynucleotide monophosphate kinase family protein n=1 Tax=Streptomyces sp. NBC_01498 TaxID=2975870 RepID=UPI002E7B036A|nr:hypothetical protein [Streptomyces sp. NBC_01498]WTL25595.1 hypothetical protein OG875_13905 [Streptomyces sp. NBC_01498]